MKRAALVLAVVLVALAGGATGSTAGNRQLRVGLVLQSTYVHDPYEGGAYAGFRRAVRELGVRGRVVAPNPRAGVLPSILYLARQKYDLISVGGYKIPTVDAYIAGYQAGARKADAGITTLNGYSSNFVNPAKCRPVALGEIGRGAGVVFQVASACGNGALQAAKEKGVWGIGVDIDQSSLGPHILTSAIKRLDVAVFSTVQALQDGTFKTGGDVVFSLRNGGVGLGKISPKVPGSLVRRVAAIRKQIIAGKITVPSTLGRP